LGRRKTVVVSAWECVARIYLRSIRQGDLSRRQFLRFIASSPLYGWVPDALTRRPQVSDVLNVMELEALAREAVPPAHSGYLSTGVDDDLTLNLKEWRPVAAAGIRFAG